jgi:chemotaxis protein MotB
MKYIVLAALFASAACVSPEAHKRVVGEKEALQALYDGMRADHDKLVASNDRLRAEVTDLQKRALSTAEIEEQRRALARFIDQKDASLGALGKDVEVIRTNEGIAFRVTGGVLFASGRDELSEQGKQTLLGLAKELQGKRVRVDGHTDDEPISRSQWGTNLRLSVARSLAVADFLIQSCKLPAASVCVAGYGEHRPAQAGSDDAARRRNRRVEILMLGE